MSLFQTTNGILRPKTDILVLGPEGSGKTCLIKRLTDVLGEFDLDENPTEQDEI